jgi:hypothetical protein
MRECVEQQVQPHSAMVVPRRPTFAVSTATASPASPLASPRPWSCALLPFRDAAELSVLASSLPSQGCPLCNSGSAYDSRRLGALLLLQTGSSVIAMPYSMLLEWLAQVGARRAVNAELALYMRHPRSTPEGAQRHRRTHKQRTHTLCFFTALQLLLPTSVHQPMARGKPRLLMLRSLHAFPNGFTACL